MGCLGITAVFKESCSKEETRSLEVFLECPHHLSEWLPATCFSPCPKERCFHIVDLTSPGGVGLFFTQGSFQRCPGTLLWMASIQHAQQLWIWDKLLNRACPLLPERWLLVNSAQWNTWYHWKLVVRGVPWCLDRTPFATNHRRAVAGASANIDDGARLDIAANGFWEGRFEKTYFDVKLFNAHAPTNWQQSLASKYKKHERIKVRAYEQRVCQVEHGSFTPLVMSTTAGG